MIGKLFDNVIALVAPGWAVGRAQARALLKVYQAADKSRRNRDWVASGNSADAAIIPDTAVINARSRQMLRDSPIARAIQLAKVRNIVGCGITPIPTATAPDGKDLQLLNRAAEARFMAWADDPRLCDVEARRTFWQMQELAIAEKCAVGNLIFVWSYDPIHGFRLQAFEVEQLDTTKQQFEGNEVRNGVEIDINGKPVAYHLYTRNPNDYLFRKSLNSRRVPAEQVLHFFRPERVMQTLGVSDLAPVLQRIRDAHQRDDAELMAARMEACIGLKISRSIAPVMGEGGEGVAGESGASTTTPGGVEQANFVPGMVFRGGPGETVESHAPTRPGGSYEPYTRQILRSIGAATDLSYSQINRDFSLGSWSSEKQSTLEDQRSWKPDRNLLTSVLVAPAYELWYGHEVLRGTLPITLEEYATEPKRFSEAEYVPDSHESVEPAKDLEAAEKAISLGLATRKSEAAKRGLRHLKVMDQLRDEGLAAKERGLTFPSDPSAVPPPMLGGPGAPPGAPQAGPPDAGGPKPKLPVAPAQMAALDCGTGAGGFQPGNKCGGEGDGDASSAIGRIAERAAEIPGKIYDAAKAKVKKTFGKLETRYGRKFAIAIMAAGLVGFPIPLPGASLLTAAPVIAAAEIYRATSSSLAAGDEEFPELSDEEIERLGKEFVAELMAEWMPEASLSAALLCEWRRIGAQDDGDGESSGGAAVCIGEGGKIEKGPEGMTGNKVSKPKGEKADVEPVPKAEPKAERASAQPKAFKSPTHAESSMSTATKAWRDSLSYDESQGIKGYAGTSDSFKINNGLRNGKLGAREKVTVDRLSAALDRAELPEAVTGFRAINPKTPEERQKILSQFQASVGKSIVDKAFVSTTVNKAYADTWSKNASAPPIKCEIVIPKGAKAAYLPKDLVDRQEWEVVLQKKSKFKVAKVEGDTVYLEMVGGQ